jgi:hypothetical protein
MIRCRSTPLMLWLLFVLGMGVWLFWTGSATAEPLADDGGAEWRLEQPEAPEPPTGVERPKWLVGLGHVGDIEFQAPNRGALITAGNGSTVSPGVWLYNGQRWRELSTVCGATDGRIAWAGPDEFWTVSDGRPGQAPNSQGVLPPLEDNTLCHFAVNPASHRFEVVGSYATLGFQSTSYQAMHGAACLTAKDCWFGGEPLPEPGLGAFQLHWNGATVSQEPFPQEGHPAGELRSFEGSIYESVQLREQDRVLKQTGTLPPLHRIAPGEGGQYVLEPLSSLPLYGPSEPPFYLDAVHLGVDQEALWAAAGPSQLLPEGSPLENPAATIVRYSKKQYSPVLGEYIEEPEAAWAQIVGPETSPTGKQQFGEDAVITSISGEPATHAAWVALDTIGGLRTIPATAPAKLARVGADGTVSDRLTLPEAGGPAGPKGGASHVVCPATHDCWMVTTQGWIFHLSLSGESFGVPADQAFAEVPGEIPITVRPADEGVPQTQPDAPPEDNSGLGESSATEKPEPKKQRIVKVKVPLLTHLRSHLIHGSTLQLSFHLAVRARVKLVAMRKRTVVAATRALTLKAGNRSVTLKLSAGQWPTKLDLQTHALAPLPTKTKSGSNVNEVGTSERMPMPAGLGARSLLP